MLNKRYTNFQHGKINNIEAKSIPAGAASDSLNWLTSGDKIELVRGRLLLGTEVSGSGKITGLHVAKNWDGVEVLFSTLAKKLQYYKTSTSDWVENGSNVLGDDADGEDISMANHNSLAGASMFVNSPNSTGIQKVMVANPGDAVDVYNISKNHKGHISINESRTFLWRRKDTSTLNIDDNNLYLSYIDDEDATTTISAENIGTGDGTTKTFTGTLTERTGRRTVFGMTATDTSETFIDNYDGTLTGDAGGTGTINYATGAFSVTFNAAPANSQAITSDYQHVDSATTGVMDFTESATRLAGEGALFRQGGGGKFQKVVSIEDDEYCFHENNLWKLKLSADDTAATNLPFREGTGISSIRAAVGTGDGVYYVDDSDSTDVQIRLLAISETNEKVVPVSVSRNLDLTDLRFNKAAMIEWGDFIIVACRHKDSTDNNRVLAYNRLWKSWDVMDWYAHTLAVYNGVLHVGDSISSNVYEVFSGLDDDDSTISNFWTSWETDLEIDGLKKVKRLRILGEIGPDQELEVFISYDNGGFTSVGTIVGSGSYVDKSQSIDVGAQTIGKSEIGGGGGDGAIPAFSYQREIKLRSDKFKRCRLKFVANELGYASVSEIEFADIRHKGTKIPSRFRTTN